MARKGGLVVKLNDQIVVRKMLASVALLAFIVVMIASLRAGANLYTVSVRAAIVMLVVKVFSVVVLRLLTTYEEIGCGQE